MDPISDMLTQIRNAQAVQKEMVSVPYSNLKYEIAKILEKEGLIDSIEKKGKKIKRTIDIVLKYINKVPPITILKRISKPGQRIYIPAKKIKLARGKYKMTIISTSKGLMTDREAKKKGLGGEVICEIWQ